MNQKDLITISYHCPIEDASRCMAQWDLRHLAVTDEGGKVVGILTESDLGRFLSEGRPSTGIAACVADYMSWPLVSVRETDPLSEVASVMVAEKVSALLVKSGEGTVVGIVTNEDLLRSLCAEKAPERQTLAMLSYSPVVTEALRELSSLGI